MIEKIKKIIPQNKKDIKISKFFHGDPVTSEKILFFVSADNKPFCIIKMARNLEANNIIEREINGLKNFDYLGFAVPKIFSIGEINNLKYVCEEIVEGEPVGQRNQFKFFPLVADYHKAIKKNKKIKIGTVLEAIKNLDIKNDKEYEQTVSLLKERKDNDIFVSYQHGDMTYQNIIRRGKNIVFIDFENFGLRSVWGNDITHYLTRMTNIYDLYKKNKSVSETMFCFVKITENYRKNYNLSITDDECADLFLLDSLFDDLQRTYSGAIKEVIPIMKNIWLE